MSILPIPDSNNGHFRSRIRMTVGLSPSTLFSRAIGFLVTLSISLAFSQVAFALNVDRAISQYGHMAWTLQEGELAGAPTAMTQTADGYVWVGTRSGLLRFDGIRFSPFVPPPGEELLSSKILSL